MAPVYQKLVMYGRKVKKIRIEIHKEIFYEHHLKNLSPPSGSKIDITVTKMEISNVNILHQVWGVDLSRCEQRLLEGHSECYLSFNNGILVGYHWVQFKGKHYIQQANRYLILGEGRDFMIYHTRVKDEYQGKGINRFILSTILDDYLVKGFRRGMIYTSSNNISNRAGIEKLGFVKYAEIKSLLIGRRYYLLSKQSF